MAGALRSIRAARVIVVHSTALDAHSAIASTAEAEISSTESQAGSSRREPLQALTRVVLQRMLSVQPTDLRARRSIHEVPLCCSDRPRFESASQRGV